jgi:predicted MFS family arabinose efflux permease
VTTEKSRYNAKLWPGLFVLFVGFFQTNVPTPLYLTWQREMGYSDAALTWVYGAYIISAITTLLAWWRWADHFRRRPVLIFGLVLGLASSITFLFATATIQLILARAMCGVMAGTLASVGIAAVVESAPARLARSAPWAVSLAVAGAFALGPLTSGLTVEFIPQPVSVLFSGSIVLLLAALLVATRWMKDHVAPGREAKIRTPRPTATPRLRRATWVAVYGYAPGFAATSFFLTLGPGLVAAGLGRDSPALVGVVTFIMGLSAVAAQLVFARRPGLKSLIAGLASLGVAMVLLSVALVVGSIALLALAMLCAGAGQGLTQAGAFALVGFASDRGNRAGALSRLSIAGYVAAAAVPVGVGLVAEFFGVIHGSLSFASAALAVCLVAVWVASSHRKHFPAD